jgi:hypothetical protein
MILYTTGVDDRDTKNSLENLTKQGSNKKGIQL